MNPQPLSIADSSFRGLIGAAQQDITPPVGIYARSWGAAAHDVAEGVHRPLMLTCISFQSREDEPPLLLMSADQLSWRSREDEWSVRGGILQALQLDPARLMLCLSHTHSAGSLRSEDEGKPGGYLIAPYRQMLMQAAVDAARRALASRKPATLTWRYGKCALAKNRDLPEPGSQRVVCGFNPAGPVDDTLLVGRISDDGGGIIATIVNYACHPTTLGWENRLLSPDYPGAMRELVASQTSNASVLFLQGASGELAPAEQYTGDTAVADRHGRHVGYAVLSTLEAMGPAQKSLSYDRVVESGAPLAVWSWRDAPSSTALAAAMTTVDLPLKDMPTVAELDEQVARCTDRVMRERLGRRRAIRKVVGEGSSSAVPLWVWRLGDSLLIGQPNEAYSMLQQRLRQTFAPRAVAVMNLVNGSAGYLPPRELYGREQYQLGQTPFAAGSLERLIKSGETSIQEMLR